MGPRRRRAPTGYQRGPHRHWQLVTAERGVLATAAQRIVTHRPVCLGVDHAEVGQLPPSTTRPMLEASVLNRLRPQHGGRALGQHGQRAHKRYAVLLGSISLGQAQQQLDRGGAGPGLGEGADLASASTGLRIPTPARRWCRRPLRRSGFAVALLAHRRLQAQPAVEIADVDVGQAQVVTLTSKLTGRPSAPSAWCTSSRLPCCWDAVQVQWTGARRS